MVQTVISTLNNWLYTYILIILLLGAGAYFSIRTGFVQFRLMKEAFRTLREKRHGDGVGGEV